MSGVAIWRWPSVLQDAMARAYREAGGRGADERGRMDAALEAFLDSGGVAPYPRAKVAAIVRHLMRERGEWMLEPAQEWALREHRRYRGRRPSWRRAARREGNDPC